VKDLTNGELSTQANLYVSNFECEVPRFARDDNGFTLDVMLPLD